MDICNPPLSGAYPPSGYLTSPNYPNDYPPDLTCVAQISQDSAHGTRTRLLDLDMEARTTVGCYDWLVLRERDRPIRVDYCGSMATVDNDLEQLFSQLKVAFHPDMITNFRGFLLKYERK